MAATPARPHAPKPYLPPPERTDWLRPLFFGGAFLVVLVGALLLLFFIDDAPPDQLTAEELAALMASPPEPTELPPLWETPTRPSGLDISTTPARASVWLNNEWIGVSPVRIEEQPPGYYTLSLEAEGHVRKDTSFYLASGTFFLFDVELDSAEPIAALEGPTETVTSPNGPAAEEPRRQLQQTGQPAGGGTPPTAEPAPPQFEIATPEDVQQVSHTGSLSITSNPPGAIVFVDGVPFGRAPLSLSDLRPDTYIVTLTLPGLEPLSYQAEVTARSMSVVKATFPPPADN